MAGYRTALRFCFSNRVGARRGWISQCSTLERKVDGHQPHHRRAEPAERHPRGDRNPARRRAGEVRDRQGSRARCSSTASCTRRCSIPGNYGFIPHTLSADGDPCDVLVVSQVPVVPGAVIRCRPVGALLMEDEAGGDEKILAVPVDALHPFYTRYPQLSGPAGHHVRADRALLPALQGPGKGQVGHDRRAGRCRRSRAPDHGGIERAFQGLEPKNRRKTDKALEAPAAKSGKKAKVKAATVKTPVKKSKTKKAVKKVTKKKTKR